MSTTTSLSTVIPAGTWAVDPAHSKVGFAVKHMGIATVRGEFTDFEGTLEIGEDLSTARAYGKVKAASVDTNEPQRDEHLRSGDFFDAANYPELTFESKGEPLLMPNPWDAGTAKILASLDFQALATTSNGYAATLGRDDYGVTREEAIAHSRTIVDATDLPVSADLENAFADEPEGVAET